jgi:hypothetical protein
MCAQKSARAIDEQHLVPLRERAAYGCVNLQAGVGHEDVEGAKLLAYHRRDLRH